MTWLIGCFLLINAFILWVSSVLPCLSFEFHLFYFFFFVIFDDSVSPLRCIVVWSAFYCCCCWPPFKGTVPVTTTGRGTPIANQPLAEIGDNRIPAKRGAAHCALPSWKWTHWNWKHPFVMSLTAKVCLLSRVSVSVNTHGSWKHQFWHWKGKTGLNMFTGDFFFFSTNYLCSSFAGVQDEE